MAFQYLGEVIEQRSVPNDNRLYWFFNQSVPAGASIILFGWGNAQSQQHAGQLYFPGNVLKGSVLLEALHTAWKTPLPLGFDVPLICRLRVTEEIPVDSYLFNLNVGVFSGHAFEGLRPDQWTSTEFDGTGLVKKPFEHYLRTEGQAPEGIVAQDITLATGAATALTLNSAEFKRWRLTGIAPNLYYDNPPLTGNTWACIGHVVASTGSRDIPQHYPDVIPTESGWTMLPPRYARPYTNGEPYYRIVGDEPDPVEVLAGIPSSHAFYREVTGATPRQFLSTLNANWRAGVIFIAYKLPVRAKHVWHLRDKDRRQLIFYVAAPGWLVVNRYTYQDSAPTTVTIDASDDCSWPCFRVVNNLIEGTYLRGTTPLLARSTDGGRNWLLTTIPGSYEAITSAHHRGRLVVAGFRSGTWYLRVGKLLSDRTYSWSNERLLSTVDPDGAGHLTVRHDQHLEFTYLSSGSPLVIRCSALDLDAQGTFV